MNIQLEFGKLISGIRYTPVVALLTYANSALFKPNMFHSLYGPLFYCRVYRSISLLTNHMYKTLLYIKYDRYRDADYYHIKETIVYCSRLSRWGVLAYTIQCVHCTCDLLDQHSLSVVIITIRRYHCHLLLSYIGHYILIII